MSVDGWQTVLVLGGIRSGKSEFAESLVGDAASVRYVATATDVGSGDPEWAARIEAHRLRRPDGWATEETGANPSRLAELIARAQPDETLLVDDLGGWVTVLLDPAYQPADDTATINELATAIRDSAARLILVSPEVGLSMVPTTPLGRVFADALGTTNQAVAQACDAVALVVAGQPTWLKAAPVRHAAVPAQVGPAQGETVPAARTAGSGANAPAATAGQSSPAVQSPAAAWPDVLTPTVAEPAAPAAGAAWATPTMTLPLVSTGLVIQPGMELPLPDEYAGPQALDRLATLDLPGAGLGNLAQVVSFAAGTQGTPTPAPWRSVRVMLIHGDHAGGAAAGALPAEASRRANQARNGEGVLARLAAEAGASLQVIDAPGAAPIEEEPALSEGAVESALRYGWRLAEEAVDSGVQVLVLAACGAGTEAAAAAVLAATAGAEPAAVLSRVMLPGGQIDDTAWMQRCAAVRDALHRTRHRSRAAKDVLAELAGGDIAIATGILLGATARRTPVLLDGPVGVAAGLVSRELAGQARHWCLLPDHGNQPGVRLAADVLGLTPLVDLRLDLGEGATALATLPMLRSALTLASALPGHPVLAAEAGDDTQPAPAETEPDDEEYIEPVPAGPGPTEAPDAPTPGNGATEETPAAPRPGTDASGNGAAGPAAEPTGDDATAARGA